jgi:GGDEF domain-containing protein
MVRNNRMMNLLETIIWSGMLGGLLTLATLAIADVVMSRSLAAWRGLAYMLLAGSSCVVLSGLPEDVFPNLPALTMLIFKAGLGPLSGAITLTYLGQWLGVAAEDRLVHRTIVWGAAALIAASMFMSAMLVLYADKDNESILVLAAWVNCASVLMATFASVRAAQLGDMLARWMVVACLLLAISVSGLYTHSLRQSEMHPVVWLITSCATVGFFLVVVALGITRNRLNRRLERLAGLSRGMDPATGLPRGSVLLSKVDDAFWRSARLEAECVVVCIHLRNLYELSETAGHSTDQQILVAITARIRRAVGFRCVVGLYHPRCFVVVFSAVTQPKLVARLMDRLRYLLARQLTVVGQNDANFVFTPQFSFGMVSLKPTGADPATVIDQAERIALGSEPGVDISFEG